MARGAGARDRQDVETDGRRARRQRNRLAVIDAMFELLGERDEAPSAEDVADRAGVSVSSLFRYFENLDELQQHTIERYFERFSHLFEIADVGQGPLDHRIRRLVDARISLYEQIGPIARMARRQAPEHPRLAASLHETRRHLAGQVAEHFAPELQGLGRAAADDRIAVVDVLLSFESWDLMRSTHQRSRRQIARAWTDAVTAVVSR